MTPGGIIFFSTNFRRFKLAEAELAGLTIREISRQTVPPTSATAGFTAAGGW